MSTGTHIATAMICPRHQESCRAETGTISKLTAISRAIDEISNQHATTATLLGPAKLVGSSLTVKYVVEAMVPIESCISERRCVPRMP
jgi:hypothetical protein